MDIQKETLDLIAKQLGLKAENIKLEDEFINDLKADSLDVVELVISLEEKFNISVPDETAENFISVQKIVDYVKKKKA